MPLRGSLGEQFLDVRKKSEVEHAVGFVKDHDLDVREGQQFLAGEVEQTAWRPDDDLCSGLDFVNLLVVGLPTVNRGDGR